MIGFIISAIVVAVLFILSWLIGRVIMYGDRVAIAAVCFIIFIIIGLVINSAINAEVKGPCHKYETQLMYNAATKTMMPSRVCVLRGEWVGEE